MFKTKHNTLFSALKKNLIFFNKYLLSTYYMSGTILDSRDSLVNMAVDALYL